MTDNLERMRALAEEFFGVKNDPEQIAVDDAVLRSLRQIHVATVTEERNSDGPIAWVLVIPTTEETMRSFLDGSLSERALLAATPPGISYGALYLSSALVLPEFRRKGVARRLLLGAIGRIRSDHPIRSLYCWPFSMEGERLARSVAAAARLPLRMRVSSDIR